MNIDAKALGTQLANSFIASLKKSAPDIKDYAESEGRKLAQTLVMIESLVVQKKISNEEAKLQLDIQRNASKTVFLTIEGLGLLAVEAAINAALGVVKDAVNKAIGFSLI